MKRLKFWDLFEFNQNGSLSPKKVIRVNGITFGQGVTFGKGVSFGGVDFFDYWGKDIAVEEVENSILEVKGFYRDESI